MSTLDLITTDEVAQMLRVAPSTVRFWRAAKQGPTWTKIGKRCLYKRSDVERWFDDQTRLTQGLQNRTHD